jgi:hypothetical protein
MAAQRNKERFLGNSKGKIELTKIQADVAQSNIKTNKIKINKISVVIPNSCFNISLKRRNGSGHK